MNRLILAQVFLLAAGLSFWPYISTASPSPFKIDFSQAKGEIGFHAIGNPSALKINGKADSSKEVIRGVIEVKDDVALGTVSFTLDTLDTGIKLRDKHMKDKYLEVKQYPIARFELSKLKLPKIFLTDKAHVLDEAPFSGKFTVHGIEKDVQGKVRLKREGKKVFLQARFSIKLSDHGIEVPSFMGITVAQDMTVYADLEGQMVAIE